MPPYASAHPAVQAHIDRGLAPPQQLLASVPLTDRELGRVLGLVGADGSYARPRFVFSAEDNVWVVPAFNSMVRLSLAGAGWLYGAGAAAAII